MRNVDKADRVLFLDNGVIQSGTKHQYQYLMEREAAPTDANRRTNFWRAKTKDLNATDVENVSESSGEAHTPPQR